MSSVILQCAVRFLTPSILVFSVLILLRGHNQPGGGFIGGLLASGAIALYALAHETKAARRLLRLKPSRFMGVGLLLSLGSGMPALLSGRSMMASFWIKPEVPFIGTLHLGTPLLFDFGVFLVVLGVTTHILFSMMEA